MASSALENTSYSSIPRKSFQKKPSQLLSNNFCNVELAGEVLQVQDIELVGGGEGEEERHTSRYLLHFNFSNVNPLFPPFLLNGF